MAYLISLAVIIVAFSYSAWGAAPMTTSIFKPWNFAVDPRNGKLNNISQFLEAANFSANPNPPCFVVIVPVYFSYYATYVGTFTQATSRLVLGDGGFQSPITKAPAPTLIPPKDFRYLASVNNTKTIITTLISGSPTRVELMRAGGFDLNYFGWLSIGSDRQSWSELLPDPEFSRAIFTPYRQGVRQLSSTAYYSTPPKFEEYFRNPAPTNERRGYPPSSIQPPVFTYIPPELFQKYPRVASCLPVMQYFVANPFETDQPLYHQPADTVAGGIFFAPPTATPGPRITGVVPATASIGPTLVVEERYTRTYTSDKDPGPLVWYTGTPAQDHIELMTATALATVVGPFSSGVYNTSYTDTRLAMVGTTAVQNGTVGTSRVYQVFVLTAIFDQKAFSNSSISIPQVTEQSTSLKSPIIVSISTAWATSSVDSSNVYSAGFYVAGPIPKSVFTV